MGICGSCDSTHVATAKLILQDGRLMEFSSPVKVSFVLQKISPMCFICNSDDMEFDDVASAVDADEDLQIGNIYFALPMCWLRHPLQAEEMAALAVKASSALSCGYLKCRCRRKCVSPLVFSGDKPSRSAEVGDFSAGGGGRSRRGGGDCGSGRRKAFAVQLSSIAE